MVLPTSFDILALTRSHLTQYLDNWRAQLYMQAFLTSSSGIFGNDEISGTSPVCHLSILWGYPGNDEIADLAKVADAGGVLGQHRVPPADHTVQNCHDKSLKIQTGVIAHIFANNSERKKKTHCEREDQHSLCWQGVHRIRYNNTKIQVFKVIYGCSEPELECLEPGMMSGTRAQA